MEQDASLGFLIIAVSHRIMSWNTLDKHGRWKVTLATKLAPLFAGSLSII